MEVPAQADPNPPPGAPRNFPVHRVSPTGLQLFLAPPYSRQDLDEPLVRGIGIKIRKPTSWIDENSQQQTWDDEWERRYPAWDCSKAGIFDLIESGEIYRLTYEFEWKLPGDHQPPVIFGVPLKYPAFGMPMKSNVPLKMVEWARGEVPKTEELFKISHHTDHFLKGALVIPARLFNECQPGTVNESDFGLIGDKVTIHLPRLRPDCAQTLKDFQDAGYYIPCGTSLYGKTEKSIGFEYRTQLLGADLGTAQNIDPAHSVENVQFENLWFVLLNHAELPTYHFWVAPEKLRASNEVVRPMPLYYSRTPAINRPGDIHRTGAIHEPIESAPITSWDVEDGQLPASTLQAAPQLEHDLATTPVVEPVPISNYDPSPAGQDGFNPPVPPVRYQKAARIVFDPAFQPSPTTDLFSHRMTTRGRVNRALSRDESLSPLARRRLKAKALKSKSKAKGKKATTPPTQQNNTATQAIQPALSTTAANAPASTDAEAPRLEPVKSSRTSNTTKPPIPSPRKTRSGLTRTSTAAPKPTRPSKPPAKAKAGAKPTPRKSTTAAAPPPTTTDTTTKPTQKRKVDQISQEPGAGAGVKTTRTTRAKTAVATDVAREVDGGHAEETLRRSKRSKTKSLKAMEAEGR